MVAQPPVAAATTTAAAAYRVQNILWPGQTKTVCSQPASMHSAFRARKKEKRKTQLTVTLEFSFCGRLFTSTFRSLILSRQPLQGPGLIHAHTPPLSSFPSSSCFTRPHPFALRSPAAEYSFNPWNSAPNEMPHAAAPQNGPPRRRLPNPVRYTLGPPTRPPARPCAFVFCAALLDQPGW